MQPNADLQPTGRPKKMVHSYSNPLDFLHSDLFVIVYLVFFRICVCVSVFVFVFVFVFLFFFCICRSGRGISVPPPPRAISRLDFGQFQSAEIVLWKIDIFLHSTDIQKYSQEIREIRPNTGLARRVHFKI